MEEPMEFGRSAAGKEGDRRGGAVKRAMRGDGRRGMAEGKRWTGNTGNGEAGRRSSAGDRAGR